MSNIPFLAGFAENAEAVPVRGRYNSGTQMLVMDKSNRASGNIMATMPTHVETATGGHDDTDTDATED